LSYRRAIISFSLALALGLAALWTAQRMIEERSAPRAEVARLESRDVVIARADVAIGTALALHQLEAARWPEPLVPAGAHAKPEALAGRVLRRAVVKGEPILESLLLPVGAEAGLAPVIPEKRRAVSVKVDPVIGVAGFVHPGARVDVLATLRRVDQSDKLPYSKLILQDVPVLAIDQKLEEGRGGDPELVNVVTLEVSPEQAEQLIYSSHEGRLQLALRSPGDREQVVTSSVGVADLLPSRSRTRPQVAARRGPAVQVLKGAQLTEQGF
jgi:pilus assembly protein CpaB